MDIMTQLWYMNDDMASEWFTQLLESSYKFDAFNEKNYYAFLSLMFVLYGFERYTNRFTEKYWRLCLSGFLLVDRRKKQALILEVKNSENLENMTRDSLFALDQISRLNQSESLDNNFYIENYGIALYEKKAIVKKQYSYQ